MILFKTEIKHTDNGKGLFSLNAIPKSTVVGYFPIGAKDISEDEYIKGLVEGDRIIIHTGVRYIGRIFLVGEEIKTEEYINHSFTPSLLYHCGILFAKKDIKIGEELTVDYRYFLANHPLATFTDTETNTIVKGFSPHEALIRSTKELIELIEGSDLEKIFNTPTSIKD